MKNIFYLGPQGSYSHTITKKMFNDNQNKLVSCKNFDSIIKHVLNDKTALGVLPIENSTTSSVHENIDFLFNEKIIILDEGYLKITLSLLGKKGTKKENIKIVYSQSKALEQCKKYITSNNFKVRKTNSTAKAKELIKKQNNLETGIIGGQDLLDNELIIIDKNIGDSENNVTRFVVIGAQENEFLFTQKNKISFIFLLPHIPGSLAKILTKFADAKLNLTKIESRPVPGTSWEYQFYVDIEDDKKNLNNKDITDILNKYAVQYKIVGLYNTGKTFES